MKNSKAFKKGFKLGKLNLAKKRLEMFFDKKNENDWSCKIEICKKTWKDISDKGTLQAIGHFRKRHTMIFLQVSNGTHTL